MLKFIRLIYSIHFIDTNLCGKQRIRHIEEQMRLCRDAYTKLKNEVAAIDRKKKKLKRDLLDKSSSNNNGNNNDENLNNSKQDNQSANNNNNNNNNNNPVSSTANNNHIISNNKKFNDLKVWILYLEKNIIKHNNKFLLFVKN